MGYEPRLQMSNRPFLYLQAVHRAVAKEVNPLQAVVRCGVDQTQDKCLATIAELPGMG